MPPTRHDARPRWAAVASVVVHAALLAGAAAAPVALTTEQEAAEPERDPLGHPGMMVVAVFATPEPYEALDPWPEPAAPSVAHEGDVDAEDRQARYGLHGPADNPDPHVSRLELVEPRSFDFYAVGNVEVGSGSEGPKAPWGRDDALGDDPFTARGRMFASEVGDARGRGVLASTPGIAIRGFT